jgi:putative transcriptional regulator
MSKVGERMIEASCEALAWADGEETGAILHEFPDVKAIRTRLGLSQAAFAKKFGLAVGNVRDWEQGRSVPDRSARVLLKVIATEPEAVVRALAA